MTIVDAIKRLEQMRADLYRKKNIKWPSAELEVQHGMATMNDAEALSLAIGALNNIVHLHANSDTAESAPK